MFAFKPGILCDEKVMGSGAVTAVTGLFQGWKPLLSDELPRGEGHLSNLLHCAANIASGAPPMW